ncbi:MAG: serine/threonine protein kinase [bacterium]
MGESLFIASLISAQNNKRRHTFADHTNLAANDHQRSPTMDTTADTFTRVETLFSLALDMPSTEWDEWLDQTCGDHPSLKQEVLSLLTAHQASGDFLSHSADLAATLDPLTDLIGKRIGAYQIRHLLGKGGMGRVYLADRVDGAYEQQVAIKFIATSSIDDPKIRHERQILANLNHPNIVHILDAGSTDDQLAYFVMEYVDGISIDEFWQTHFPSPLNKQSLRQLIQQIIEITHIVHQAHLHGIIHCDLKPSNIFYNKEGQLKLLDFGIAQAADVIASDHPEPKKNEIRYALTPEYASPQRHQQQPPTIMDDVFSLGILLAFAVSGTKPKTTPTDSCYEEPDLQAIAQTIPHKELKHIFYKATHPARNKRYSSARALREDLKNWLQKKPVQAMQGSLFYRAKKHIRRHWYYWLTGLVLITLLSVAVTVWLQKNTHQEQQDEVRKLAKYMLADLDIALEQLPRTTKVRSALVRRVNNNIADLSQQHPNNIAIQIIHASTLNRLAEVTGHPYALNQGKTRDALMYYQQALTIYENVLEKRSDRLAAYQDIATTRRKIAEITAYQGDLDTGVVMVQDTREQLEYQLRDQPVTKKLPLLILYIVEAHGRYHRHELYKAQRLLNKAWQIAHDSQKLLSTQTQTQNKKATAKAKQSQQLVYAFLQEETGHLAFLQKDYDRAELAYKEVIASYTGSDLWQNQLRLIRSHQGLSCILLRKDQLSDVYYHFEQIMLHYRQLEVKYPEAAMIHGQLSVLDELTQNGKRMRPSSQQLMDYLQCDNPLSFMIPPLKNSNKVSD